MSIQFPNASRSFDESKHRINFWGYDRTIEISFFIEYDALKSFNNQLGNTEAEMLSTFDAEIESIHRVASSIYDRSTRGKGAHTFILYAEDF